ncbi:hypothetical protein HID58_085685 [Brassica napus]|uniref:Uncharacterized protein n=1 Tax=Brassica napus TaxID=3708 RepID=A0ABQ7XNB6_BRANA|nr:hypothetical protein HID58_085685 [Brassica napus]
MSRLSISNSPHRCHELINWLLSAQLDRNTRLAALQGWQATIYTIWQYINDRIHWGISITPSQFGHRILDTIKTKCSAMVSLGQSWGSLLITRWSKRVLHHNIYNMLLCYNPLSDH